ncbi:MAG: helix-turn-helix domain-containing protein [Candidatus Sedimenticola sp. (ex Thyasira tokunagai)]
MCSVLEYGENEQIMPEGVLLLRRPVSRGETIFRKDDPFRSIFAVKSGSFKTYVPKSDRGDQVVGFQLVGELIGSEGLASEFYPFTARALEESCVCELRLSRLTETDCDMEKLQQGIIQLLGSEVAFNHEIISSLVHQGADQRIAGFLLSLSQRLERRGMQQKSMRLSMSRGDIGNYLGLASETVSRILTKLQKSGSIRLQHKNLEIIDRAALAELADI